MTTTTMTPYVSLMATVGFLPKKNDKNINERLWGWQTLLSWEPALQKKANYDMRKARRTIEKVGSQLVDQLSTNVRQWNYLPLLTSESKVWNPERSLSTPVLSRAAGSSSPGGLASWKTCPTTPNKAPAVLGITGGHPDIQNHRHLLH